MYKYYTKTFIESDEIDRWLNSFIKDVPSSESNYEVVGYIVVGDLIVITIKVFEAK